MTEPFWAVGISLFWPRMFFAFGLNLVVIVVQPTFTVDRAIALTLGCWLLAFGVIR